jgi:AbrB family looped-hinge helix DNA binding protein
MQTTIDEAGRVVIPKAIRDQAGLRAGVPLDIEFVRGCIEILPAVTPTRIVEVQGLAVLVPEGGEAITVEAVRHVQEQVRGR